MYCLHLSENINSKIPGKTANAHKNGRIIIPIRLANNL